MKILELLETDLSCRTSSSLTHTSWLDARIKKFSTEINFSHFLENIAEQINYGNEKFELNAW